ncbi:hypothetical protein [Burkholderia ubonensis]|uniref:hypothetical protein n=1 Tax=Burkholderia ubonensis TaxID=101571 RepID=UPI000A8AFBE1|nr:hypothetical protein [Burkholderia ubonensis]
MNSQKISIDWEKLPAILREKYESITAKKSNWPNIQKINHQNIKPIPLNECDTQSYVIFSTEFNSVLLTAHLFENLLMMEDIRHEKSGKMDFQIEIPRMYFRYPALNNPRDTFFGGKPIDQEEKEAISTAVINSKKNTNFLNDESFVKENLYKLEFISVYSFFEAFMESIMTDELNYSKKDASKSIRQSSLPEILSAIIDEINPEIKNLLVSINPKLSGFMELCHEIRNLHIHKLGRTTQFFIDRCTSKNLIEEFSYLPHKDGTRTPIYRTLVGINEKCIQIGKYISLPTLSFEFRNYAREIAYILNACIRHQREKNNQTRQN